jgi:predicted nuclease of predicted toxin-antitoxin system
MDVHVRAEVTEALRRRGADVVTAWEQGTAQLADPELLDRSSEEGRVLFSQDEDLLAEAARRQRTGVDFMTVIYAHQLRVSVRTCIEDLELFAKASTTQEQKGRVIYLPLD